MICIVIGLLVFHMLFIRLNSTNNCCSGGVIGGRAKSTQATNTARTVATASSDSGLRKTKKNVASHPPTRVPAPVPAPSKVWSHCFFFLLSCLLSSPLLSSCVFPISSPLLFPLVSLSPLVSSRLVVTSRLVSSRPLLSLCLLISFHLVSLLSCYLTHFMLDDTSISFLSVLCSRQ